MRLHILGCGDAFGSGGRNQSAYLLEADGRLFLLDCGPTALLAMKRAGFNPSRLEAIFLSHLHGDHYGGVPFIFLDALYENPRGTEERVRDLFRLMYGDGSRPRELPPTVFHILEPEVTTTVAGVEILPFQVPHQVRDVSLGVKLALRRKKILYSGDSAWTDLFVVHSRDADLFLCECSYFERETPNHMSYLRIQENLSRLGCKRLLLTHMSEEMLAHREGLRIQSAEDGLVIEI